jgi:malate synthase
VQYLEAWLGGNGCVPLYSLMEDAATSEISRAQVWQWLRHKATVGGAPLTPERVKQILDEETSALDGRRLNDAKELFLRLSVAETMAEFLTIPAYAQLEQ